MKQREGLTLCAAGLLALAVPVVLREIGAWFPALEFLTWAGMLSLIAGVLTLASLGMRHD